MAVTTRPIARPRARIAGVAAPLAMWAAWRLAHLVLATVVGGRPSVWWDDGFYETLMHHGYGHPDPQRQFLSTNFFPLLPWTARAVQVVVRSDWVAIHLVLTAAQIAAVLLLHRIGERVAGRRVGLGAVALLLLLPQSVFLWMFFSEGLFLALSIGAILLAEQGHARRAALLGIAVASTRTLGVLVVVPLALAQLQRGERRLRSFAVSLVPVTGVLVVMFAQWVQVGDPLSFSESSKGWGRETSSPITTVLQRIDHALGHSLTLTTVLDLCALAIAVAYAVSMTRSLRGPSRSALVLPWSIVAWTWLMIVAPLSSGLAFSWARYMLAAWPVLLVAAHDVARRPAVVRLSLALSLAVLTVFEAIAWHDGQFIG